VTALESRFKYGVLGAGAVSASLIGRLPSKTRELGPVSAVSYRVASRIANTLRAGYPVRKADELDAVPAVLFHSPPELVERLLEILEKAQIDWTGKALVFCDCFVGDAVRRRFEARGASTAVARQFISPGRIIVEGNDGAGLHAVHRIARELRMKSVEIAPGSADLFDAAVTLGSAAITPLIDRAAALLRDAGIRDTEAVRIASSVFEQTARDYAHSGQQSWVWYVRKPLPASLQAQIAAAGPHLEPVMRQLLLFGFETFQKHQEVGRELEARGPVEEE
jgi:hypothetical protein